MKRLLSLVLSFALIVTLLPVSALAAIDQGELDQHLSEELGWTQEELVEFLDDYGFTLEDFDSVEEMRVLLGPVLTDENLQELLNEYGLSYEELVELLAEFGETLDDYKFFNELDWAIFFYLTVDEEFEFEFDFDIDEDFEFEYDYEFFELAEIGLTEEEFYRLIEHLLTLDWDNPEFEAKLDRIIDLLNQFEDFESADDLSAEQIAELAAIFTELLDLFELDAKFYLVKGNEKNPVALTTLLRMDTTNGYDLLIEFYNKQGEFLADILLSAELFGGDLINETGKDLEKINEIVKEVNSPQKEVSTPAPKTEKGAKLPQTASDYLQNSMFGFLIVLLGFLFIRKLNVRGQ